MKTFIKIITCPIWITLEILAFVLTFLTITGGILLTLIAFALSVYSVYVMAIEHNFKDGIISILLAVFCSPFGLPSISASIINMIENASDKLRGV